MERNVLVCGLILLLASCTHVPASGIPQLGSFYVPGTEVTDQEGGLQAAPGAAVTGGEIETGQIYVQFARLRRPASPYPVLMIPGGSLSGVSYETTPDGRPGWQSDFLNGGYSVSIADVWQVGRSPSPNYPSRAQPPRFRSKSFLWEVFRIGPPGSYAPDSDDRSAYAGSRFPIAAFDAFSRQAFPRFRETPESERRRFQALYQAACPCIIVAHSAAGPPAVRTAIEHPELVKALILVEPSGGVELRPADIARLGALPFLFLWGDNVDADASWEGLYASSRSDFESLQRAGASAAWVDLPARGASGNSHMLMMDTNSREIALLMMNWLRDHQRRRGETRPVHSQP